MALALYAVQGKFMFSSVSTSSAHGCDAVNVKEHKCGTDGDFARLLPAETTGENDFALDEKRVGLTGTMGAYGTFHA